jgi:hAT family C-terminal dimerisation region
VCTKEKGESTGLPFSHSVFSTSLTLFQASNLSATDSELLTDDSSFEEEEFMDEVDRYLAAGQIKSVTNPLCWWVENQGTYPHLWQMAQDYIMIPGMSSSQSTVVMYLMKSLASSVAVKCIFSKGQLLMSHIHNRLSAQSTCTLLCLGAWSKAGFVKSTDLSAVVTTLPDAKDDESWSDDDWEIM